mgnify:FL=1
MLRHESYRRDITRIVQVPEIESLGFIAHTNPANSRGAIAAGTAGDSHISVTLFIGLVASYACRETWGEPVPRGPLN